MLAGELRHKIEVLTPSIIKDEYGAKKETFINYMTLKAGKKEIAGNKGIDNNEVFNSNRIDWTIYYRPSINDKMRIKYNNKEYKILYIREIGYKEGFIIETELINN